MAELENAIKTVMRGETFLSSASPRAHIDRYAERTRGNKAFGGLTSRQREVLQLVAEGHKSKEIAKLTFDGGGMEIVECFTGDKGWSSMDGMVEDMDEDEKALPFGEAEPGVTAVELLVPLTLKWAQEERVDLKRALGLITSGAARALGLNYGQITTGGPADLMLLAPDEFWKVEPAKLLSQGKNTPFIGYELPGRVRQTLVAGVVVHGI